MFVQLGGGGLAPGGVAYTTPGTYSWVAPSGCTSVSVVCVGAGGGGSSGTTVGYNTYGPITSVGQPSSTYYDLGSGPTGWSLSCSGGLSQIGGGLSFGWTSTGTVTYVRFLGGIASSTGSATVTASGGGGSGFAGTVSASLIRAFTSFGAGVQNGGSGYSSNQTVQITTQSFGGNTAAVLSGGVLNCNVSGGAVWQVTGGTGSFIRHDQHNGWGWGFNNTYNVPGGTGGVVYINTIGGATDYQIDGYGGGSVSISNGGSGYSSSPSFSVGSPFTSAPSLQSSTLKSRLTSITWSNGTSQFEYYGSFVVNLTGGTGVSGPTSFGLSAGGSNNVTVYPSGGGGGGLAWKNSIAVTPGNSYTVVVGAAGGTDAAGGASSFSNGVVTVVGGGGAGPAGGGGSGSSGDGNYTGGTGQGGYWASSWGDDYISGGGGGAAGYAGNGNSGTGGAAANGPNVSVYSYSGGGVGLYGQGASGAANSAQGGSGGGSGARGVAPDFGAGGGGGNAGSKGGVRIIWGVGKSYPSSAV